MDENDTAAQADESPREDDRNVEIEESPAPDPEATDESAEDVPTAD